MGLVYVHWTTLPKGLKIVNVDLDNIEIGKVSNIRFLVLCVSFFDCGGLAVGGVSFTQDCRGSNDGNLH
jgi:hypothetical protein